MARHISILYSIAELVWQDPNRLKAMVTNLAESIRYLILTSLYEFAILDYILYAKVLGSQKLWCVTLLYWWNPEGSGGTGWTAGHSVKAGVTWATCDSGWLNAVFLEPILTHFKKLLKMMRYIALLDWYSTFRLRGGGLIKPKPRSLAKVDLNLSSHRKLPYT